MKILALRDLAGVLDRMRAAGKKIVHCHGVFDILHVGHIRHFEEARTMGDVLVVSLTPDKYVNKGPHRPAFGEALRAEVIAALGVVDYVAVNAWPTAVETIRLLRPHVYMKGPDYAEMAKDVTGGIALEEEAVRAIGGELRFTEGLTFSSSKLVNQHIPLFAPHVSAWLERFRGRHDANEVKRHLEGLRSLKVLSWLSARRSLTSTCTVTPSASRRRSRSWRGSRPSMPTSPSHLSAVIISVSSDIGLAMSRRWVARGWSVMGTYRTESPALAALADQGVGLVACDLSDPTRVSDAASELRARCPSWDVLVLCPGTLEPVGSFAACDFDAWEESIRINFTAQMRIVHELLPARRASAPLGPCVLFFAGGGTNNAPVNYSAYIVSKIALIKMCELLDAEIADTRFTIVGPGRVKTKIHEATLRAGTRAGASYQFTVDNLVRDKCTPMERVLDCCDWLVGAPREVVSGRNFSVVFDRWGRRELAERLSSDTNLYKLRRFGNEW
jgi:rfaE bifunctional protein nucleotidyltransferase chain/domain